MSYTALHQSFIQYVAYRSYQITTTAGTSQALAGVNHRCTPLTVLRAGLTNASQKQTCELVEPVLKNLKVHF